MGFFLGDTNYLVIALLFLVCGFFIKKNINGLKEYTIVSVFGLLTPIITAFPVALGYSSGGFPNRCVFVLDVSLMLTMANALCLLGCYFSYWCRNKNKKIILAILFSLTLIFQLTCNFKLQNIKSYEIAKQIYNHTYSNYYTEYVNILNRFENHSNNEDVIIYSSELPNCNNIYNFYLNDKSSDMVNTSVAQFYDLKSISIIEE